MEKSAMGNLTIANKLITSLLLLSVTPLPPLKKQKFDYEQKTFNIPNKFQNGMTVSVSAVKYDHTSELFGCVFYRGFPIDVCEFYYTVGEGFTISYHVNGKKQCVPFVKADGSPVTEIQHIKIIKDLSDIITAEKDVIDGYVKRKSR